MSFYHKFKRATLTDPKPTMCRRCHKRLGTTQIHSIVLTMVTQPTSLPRDLWFCDRCLNEIGRSKARNS